jgi:hypothetical protein
MKKISFELLDKILEYLSDKGIMMVNDVEADLKLNENELQLAIDILKHDGYVEAESAEVSLSKSVYIYIHINPRGYRFIMSTSYVKQEEKENQVYIVNKSVLSNNNYQKKILGVTLFITTISTIATGISTYVSYQALNKPDKPAPITIQIPAIKPVKDTVILHTK